MAVQRVAAGLLVRDGRVLFGHRAAWKPNWPNHWDAIGGRLEPGETADQALIREIGEEIGVRVLQSVFLADIAHPASANGAAHLLTIFAVLDWSGGEPANICDEHSEIGWFTPEEIDSLEPLAAPEYRTLARRALCLEEVAER
ncbi:NUDIX domain-containing protein [Pelagibacterium halotolerans]|uniref:Mutator mutT protein (7,8-dihydro-8-oxoguanine-triphosphatase) / thiamin-phosphate pyrophosphorylase-like protein n=1 Tax=Pelagibacterium halotolerans (strain DSM 22347 / JCM 15775 / CGMCC 1.7692 / B2) TaxID=1082931 RepID=G4RF40_PELHB|nr:NUDIX hydrolase [Pelagibacterium halotolerans]AEQ52970.1 mutator mutT protein (7,8-dihydro-8-oxoguanine-triphosphatase) / thiamin-phosphate pyrophosphorylase-like protein [Pelagibacterium halotolerans B2]QJR17369.1 NUDIX hydrolase [Pelagibacterium halotolerans]SEA97488.1 8-oxo-dGTP diphosphatase [Pelagibacterium halotolerans]